MPDPFAQLLAIAVERGCFKEKANEWKPGDPCGVCGSTKTGYDPADGATCASCGRTDADE